MIKELRREVYCADVQVLVIDKLFEMIVDKVLHFIEGHSCFRIDTVFYSGAGHLQASCNRSLTAESLFILVQELIDGDRSSAQQIR